VEEEEEEEERGSATPREEGGVDSTCLIHVYQIDPARIVPTDRVLLL
jgi:hypothetical protein